MEYTNSPLVCKEHISNKRNPRKYPITKITIHHAACVMSFDRLLTYVATCNRNMSSNYVLRQGKLGLVVPEKYRAWTSSNAENDHRAVTIEVGNCSAGGQWPIAPEDLKLLIKWCADVCKRNGIPKLYYDGTPNGTLTFHSMFVATACPGPYLKSKAQYICDAVNALLNDVKAPEFAAQTYEVVVPLYGYTTAANAVRDISRVCTVKPGKYHVFNKTENAINVTTKVGVPGAWIHSAMNIPNVVSVESNDTLESVAKEVINGEWGNGESRKKNLSSAGYIATNVQAAVNAILAGRPVPDIPLLSPRKSAEEIAKEVIAGKWGNGADRRSRLEDAGYNYAEIQNFVNKLVNK